MPFSKNLRKINGILVFLWEELQPRRQSLRGGEKVVLKNLLRSVEHLSAVLYPLQRCMSRPHGAARRLMPGRCGGGAGYAASAVSKAWPPVGRTPEHQRKMPFEIPIRAV